MNWKKWLSYPPYKKIWFWAGRPFTYIMRDFYHEVEYVIIVGFFTLGYFARDWLSYRDFLLIVGGVTAGYILGHLFWGRKWVKGQQGE